MINFINGYQYKLIPPLGDNIKPIYYINIKCDVYSIYYHKLVTQFEAHNGYMQVNLQTSDGGRVCRKVHRLMMLTFKYFDGCENFQVNHIDGNKKNNFISNLEWVTPQQNILHAIDHNLRTPFYGTNNPNSSITEDTAKEIINLLLQGYSDTFISETLSVSKYIIQGIAGGKTWTYLSYPYADKLLATRRTHKLTNKQYHSICKFYEDNKNNFSTVKELAENALLFNGIPINDTYFRIAKRLFYRYDRKDINCLYSY